VQSLKCLLTATRFSETLLPSYSLSSPQGTAAGTADKTSGEAFIDGASSCGHRFPRMSLFEVFFKPTNSSIDVVGLVGQVPVWWGNGFSLALTHTRASVPPP
jgi:hypothetical protein